MPIQNFEQIRAKHALAFAKAVSDGKVIASGKEGGDAMKKIPPMIMANGLLAAIAFSIEERKNKQTNQGHRAIFDAIASHLGSSEIDIVKGVKDAKGLIDFLADHDSPTLKLATAEALAWLGYARRFVSGGDAEADDQEIGE